VKLQLTLCVTLVAAWPADALACMADPAPYAMVFAERPSSQPGTFSVKLTVLDRVPRSYDAVARIEAGPGDLVGQTVALVPENLGSCVTLGRRSGFAVVRRKEEEGRQFLEALAFERSWMDWLWTLFGWEPYHSPSRYEPPFRPQ